MALPPHLPIGPANETLTTDKIVPGMVIFDKPGPIFDEQDRPSGTKSTAAAAAKDKHGLLVLDVNKETQTLTFVYITSFGLSASLEVSKLKETSWPYFVPIAPGKEKRTRDSIARIAGDNGITCWAGTRTAGSLSKPEFKVTPAFFGADDVAIVKSRVGQNC